MQRTARHAVLPAIAAITLTAAQAAPTSAAPIRVVVNGTPVAFAGTPPTEIKGAVLVPLRGVFQALGAGVRYDPAAKTVHAQKGAASVVLPLGATTATVNGQAQALSQPAQTLGGTTLVPLRFVAQALGAYVQWDAATDTVQIKTVDPHLASLPTPRGTGPITGQATGVYADASPPTITVRVNGVNTSVPLGPQTVIQRAGPDGPASAVPLSALRAGDQVTVQRDPSGSAVSVTATSGEVRGTVKSIGPKLADGGHTLTLNDGTTLQLAPGVPVRMAGRRVTLGDVMSNEDVVVRTSPDNKLGLGLAVVTPDDPDPTPPGGQSQNTVPTQ